MSNLVSNDKVGFDNVNAGRCEVCDTKFTSPMQAEVHFRGK